MGIKRTWYEIREDDEKDKNSREGDEEEETFTYLSNDEMKRDEEITEKIMKRFKHVNNY